jgi:serine/threonine-protein kinase
MSADRDLLFCLLVLQNGLIDQVQLVAGFQAWTRYRSQPLAEHLATRGDLDPEQRAGVEAMVGLHLKKYGGDVEKSLAALPAGRSTREGLANLGDPDIVATLGHVGSGHGSTEGGDAESTTSYAVGTATSDGQRFRVLRPHAKGGLGAVFVALDSELNREVALKQIQEHHADDPTSRQRFLVEAEVTGSLEHPGIVPVYGLGTYGDGRPYYAMRFIKGDSLKEAVDRFHADESLKGDPGRRSLELRRLLRRFTDVSNAIEYAHSRGVLHRDIKPGNIIVGKHGETLVVDWGLAKATGRAEPGAEERTLMPPSASGSTDTLPGSALGTPAYMSPEQAGGDLEGLGSRSDVYSLGATLYCLLTGKPPQEGDDLGEVLRRVQRGEFMPPRRRDPSIDRAMEAVCLKAMAPRAENRYGSCRALAEDIDRWMADEPVSAWKEPWTRTLLRWLTRHRTGVTGGAVAGLAGVVGLVAVLAVEASANARLSASLAREFHASKALSASLARETEGKTALAGANAELTRSKAAVQARYDQAVEAIKTFHTGVSEDFLLKQDRFKELRNRLLRSAMDFYGRLATLLGGETDLASRRALAASSFELARLTDKVGRKADALAAYRAVLAAREALSAEIAADPLLKVDVGQSLTLIGWLLAEMGRTTESLAAFRRSEALLTGLAKSDQTARAELCECRSGLADLLSTSGHVVDAIEVYRQTRRDQEELVAAPNATRTACRELGVTMTHLGILLSETGRMEESQSELRSSIAVLGKLVEEDPRATDVGHLLANSHTKLGAVLWDSDRPTAAESEFRTALAILRKLADENAAITTLRLESSRTLYNLGVLLVETGRPTEAADELHTAVSLLQRLADDDPAATEFRLGLLLTHTKLGNLLWQMGMPERAEDELRAAITIGRRLADDNPAATDFRSRLAHSRYSVGDLLRDTGRPTAAEDAYRVAMGLLRKLPEDNPVVPEFQYHLAHGRHRLGRLWLEAGKTVEARAEYRAALDTMGKLADANPAVAEIRSELGRAHDGYGELLSRTGLLTEAEAEHRLALAISQKLIRDNPKLPSYREDAANSSDNLSIVLRRLGRSAESREYCKQSVAIHRTLLEENPRLTIFSGGLGKAHLNLGLILEALGQPAGAAAEIRRSLEILNGPMAQTGEQFFLVASSHAALAGLAGVGDSGVRRADRPGHAEAAIELLRKAVRMGQRSPDALRAEEALDSLRGRDDFYLLMMDLAVPVDPFAAAR